MKRLCILYVDEDNRLSVEFGDLSFDAPPELAREFLRMLRQLYAEELGRITETQQTLGQTISDIESAELAA